LSLVRFNIIQEEKIGILACILTQSSTVLCYLRMRGYMEYQYNKIRGTKSGEPLDRTIENEEQSSGTILASIRTIEQSNCRFSDIAIFRE